jgi:hypothetical protein
MKRLRLPQLETARQNPAAFAIQLAATSGRPTFGNSKFMDWQRSAQKYLETRDADEARQYLQLSFRGHFKDTPRNRRDLKAFTEILDDFVSEISKKKLVFIEGRKNIELSLVQDQLKLTGQIPTIFMNPSGGYSVFFMHRKDQPWRDELRFPVVQYYFAKRVYGVDLRRVEVGVFDFRSRSFDSEIYSVRRVGRSIRELRSLGRTIVAHLSIV